MMCVCVVWCQMGNAKDTGRLLSCSSISQDSKAIRFEAWFYYNVDFMVGEKQTVIQWDGASSRQTKASIFEITYCGRL
jgi:hypothetical protein